MKKAFTTILVVTTTLFLTACASNYKFGHQDRSDSDRGGIDHSVDHGDVGGNGGNNGRNTRGR